MIGVLPWMISGDDEPEGSRLWVDTVNFPEGPLPLSDGIEEGSGFSIESVEVVPSGAFACPEERSVVEPLEEGFLGVVDEGWAGLMDEGLRGAVAVDGHDLLFLMASTVVESGEGVESRIPAEMIDAPCVDEGGFVER